MKIVPDPATTDIVPPLALAYQGNLANTAIATHSRKKPIDFMRTESKIWQ